MSDDQPPRLPADPGPDWWPRFGWRQAARWTLTGFLFPMAIFIAIWAILIVLLSITSGAFLSETAVSQGGTSAAVIYIFVAGSIVVTQIFRGGAKWSTFFRLLGFAIATVVQWNLFFTIIPQN